MANTTEYQSLRTSDDATDEEQPFFGSEDALLSSGEKLHSNPRNVARSYGRVAASFYILSVVLLLVCSRFPTDEQCTRKMSTWSPMIEAVEYEWQSWDIRNANKYTGTPTKESEMEWDYLWQYGTLGIPTSKLHLLNKSENENWLYTPEELGGGVTAYFETFHHVHCVNLIRQYTYRDQYNYEALPAFDQSPAMLLDHVEHCIEMLRIDVMCWSDETPYPIELNEEEEEVANPSAMRRCRNFQSLIDWAEDHIVEPYNATVELAKHADEHFEKNMTASTR